MLSVNPSLECVYSIESGPCERVDVFHVSDDWIGYNVSDWFMRDMTTKELIIMADPNRPRHYEEEFKRQIVQPYENGKPSSQIRAEYGIPRSTLQRWVQGDT